jgi:ankyrin repeat protein
MTSTARSNTDLAAAIVRRSLQRVQAQLRGGADPNGIVDTVGTRMLAYAINKGAGLHICRALLDAGAAITCADEARHDPLYAAAIKGNLAVCKELIKRGASPDRLTSAGVNALHVAAINGHYKVCEYFVGAGVDVRAMTKDGLAALDYAVRAVTDKETMQIVELLVAHGASSSHAPKYADGQFLTAFQRAVTGGADRIVAFLISKCGEDPEQITLNGRSMTELATTDAVRRVLRAALTERQIATAVDPINASSSCSPNRCIPSSIL